MSTMGATKLIPATDRLPAELMMLLQRWRLDRIRGNVQLNISEGRIVSFKIEQITTIKAD